MNGQTDGRTNGQMNGVTMSLLELLIVAKNVQIAQIGYSVMKRMRNIMITLRSLGDAKLERALNTALTNSLSL